MCGEAMNEVEKDGETTGDGRDHPVEIAVWFLCWGLIEGFLIGYILCRAGL